MFLENGLHNFSVNVCQWLKYIAKSPKKALFRPNFFPKVDKNQTDKKPPKSPLGDFLTVKGLFLPLLGRLIGGFCSKVYFLNPRF
jgi:hypothetical protein